MWRSHNSKRRRNHFCSWEYCCCVPSYLTLLRAEVLLALLRLFFPQWKLYRCAPALLSHRWTLKPCTLLTYPADLSLLACRRQMSSHRLWVSLPLLFVSYLLVDPCLCLPLNRRKGGCMCEPVLLTPCPSDACVRRTRMERAYACSVFISIHQTNKHLDIA